MKFIIGSRGSGVTTDLLLEASQFNRPIIVPTEVMKHYIKDECVRLGIKCPNLYNFGQVKLGALKDQNIDIVYISDVNLVLNLILKDYGFNGKIGTVSASLEFEE